MNDEKAALSLYIKADEMCSKCLPVHHRLSIDCATVISELYKALGNICEALKYDKRIFEFCEAMLSPSDKQFKVTWKEIVLCCLKLNQEEEAKLYLTRVLKICQRDPSSTQEISNKYVACIAIFCEKAMKFDLALNYYMILFHSNATEINEFLSTKSVEYNLDEENKTKNIAILKFKLSTYKTLFPVDDIKVAEFLIEMCELFIFYQSVDLAYQCYQQAYDIYNLKKMDRNDNDLQICWKKLIDFSIKKKYERFVLVLSEKMPTKDISDLLYISDKYNANGDAINALRYLEKVLKQIEITQSHKDLHVILDRFLQFYAEGQEQIIDAYIQRILVVSEIDSLELSTCQWILFEWHLADDRRDKALKCYEYFLASTSEKTLDRLWINFILVDRSPNYQHGVIGEYMLLTSLMNTSQRHFPSLHFKNAIILWRCGACHETIKMTNAAFDFYSEATEMFEKLIYDQNDARTKQALIYFLSETLIRTGYYSWKSWLKGPSDYFLAKFSLASEKTKWKCILQRLKLLKMYEIDNQWKFHLIIEEKVSNPDLCTIVLDKMLEICNEKMHSDESNTSLDTHSLIVCFDFISHWYLAKERFFESLLCRQFQLELESKVFNEHPHRASSLWFIGLIFQKTKEYHLSFGYLNSSLKMFERLHPKEHSDIQRLEECIVDVKQEMSSENLSQLSESSIKIASHQKSNYIPKIIQTTFQID